MDSRGTGCLILLPSHSASVLCWLARGLDGFVGVARERDGGAGKY